MPSSWSARILSSSGGPSNTAPTRSANITLPRLPSEHPEGPTLPPERGPTSPSRPQPVPRKEHTRSSSNPLPKLFGRKKSNGNLKFNDTDVPFDDDLVPVLEERAATRPTQATAGKRNRADDDGTTIRNCMCCNSKVKVPWALTRFRCTCCLTVNDLKSIEEQAGEGKGRPHVKRPEQDPNTQRPSLRLPISIERTRAIVDRCLLTYLESRGRRREEGAEHNSTTTISATTHKEDVFQSDQLSASPPVDPRFRKDCPTHLQDASRSPSPPNTPGQMVGDENPTRLVRGSPGYDQSAIMSSDVVPPEGKLSLQGLELSRRLPRKPLPNQPSRKPPPPPVDVGNRPSSRRLLPHGDGASGRPNSPRPPPSPRLTVEEIERRRRYDTVKTIFRPLEDYLQSVFGNYQSLNSSFSTLRPVMTGRTRSESNIPTPPPELVSNSQSTPIDGLSQLDAKTLLLGDIGENGTWWTGKFDRSYSGKVPRRKKVGEGSQKAVSSRSPNINWNQLTQWYDLVHDAGLDWRKFLGQEKHMDGTAAPHSPANIEDSHEIEADLAEAREHVVRTLLKITENMLKQPSRPMREPEDLRFLLIILQNRSLYPASQRRQPDMNDAQVHRSSPSKQTRNPPAGSHHSSPPKATHREGNKHTGLLKRIFGLMANASELCHRYLVGWFARIDEVIFLRLVDLVASFVTYRISRRAGNPRSRNAIQDSGLIPDLSGSAMSTSAQLHSAMGLSGSIKSRADKTDAEPDWTEDWQITAAAKVMSLLFAANNIWQGRHREADPPQSISFHSRTSGSPQAKAHRSGQLLHTSGFYNTLLDYHDLIADFKIWETKREKFAFCQYPLFISMGSKIKILEYDARRQMEIKAREAYFDQVIERRAIDGHFHLRVRRDCMVEDSFQQISAAVGAGQEELKKGLRVHFTGEEGVDAGGLRKEWFLLLVRDIFSPDHGMFVYDDTSNTCYFNPNSFETSDQYYLVGALLGLAIYNSTILDVALPPFAFRKLLAAAPSSITNPSNLASLTGTKGQMTYTLSDLAEFRPSLAAGLQQLLDYDGDVEATYCRDFVASVETYGIIKNVPLIPNGEKTPVTNSNREEFVDAYVRYLLDTAVSRQFEPFKRGFFTVCAGNALSLFRAEEIELLVRGSDEALDVSSLKAVAVYENWKNLHPPHHILPAPADAVPVLTWFWELFAEASPGHQRKLLTFITGSDRIPAVGATSLILRIVAGGDGWGGGGPMERTRFPVARTCFNMLVLWHYDSREQLEAKLWRAVEESEGFGLK